MYPRYYALRRVNPYRGVVQIATAGDAAAHSFDGVTWHLRADDGYGWTRPVGIWVAGEGLRAGHGTSVSDLLPALETHPALPFPIIDTQELWLLDKESGLPLALLACDRAAAVHETRPDGQWHPFVLSHTGFVSPTLAERDRSDPHPVPHHRDVLARIVNQAARPYAAAQWFKRDVAGAGIGGGGLRIPTQWQGRALAASDFPELLVRETWNSRLEKSVIHDYHAALAPILLCWPRLSSATRARLEELACEQPRWLARIHRLLPLMIDADRIRAALVAARFEAAAGDPEPDWN